MNEKKERSYAKESTKSTPSGIRFDLEKLAFIQKRENLSTKQKVVDFLLNDYWWKWKNPIVTAKETPPLTLKAEPAETPMFSVKPQQSANYAPIPLPVLMNSYFEKKRECQNAQEWADLSEKIDSDPRLNKQARQVLKTTNQ
jgi:hypothetical protein